MSLLPPHPFQFLIPSNLLIEFLLHLVDEIGTAGILAQFDGRVVAVALLGVEPEELVEGRGEHLQGCLSVVNAAHLAQPVNQFHEVEGVARPLQGLWRFAFGGSNIGWMDVGCEWWHFGVVLAGELHHLAMLNDNARCAEYLTALNQTLYLRDIVERNRIVNIHEFAELMKVMASSIGSPCNPNKIANTFKTNSKSNLDNKSIANYLSYMEDAFIIEKSVRYDIKGRKYIGTLSKYYFQDIGLRNALLNFR